MNAFVVVACGNPRCGNPDVVGECRHLDESGLRLTHIVETRDYQRLQTVQVPELRWLVSGPVGETSPVSKQKS